MQKPTRTPLNLLAKKIKLDKVRPTQRKKHYPEHHMAWDRLTSSLTSRFRPGIREYKWQQVKTPHVKISRNKADKYSKYFTRACNAIGVDTGVAFGDSNNSTA